MKKCYTVCFDSTCGLCGNGVRFLKRHLPSGEALYAPLQDVDTLRRLGMDEFDPLTEMKVIRADDSVLGGPDAVRFLAQRIGWLKLIAILSQIPGIRGIFDRVYWAVALNRHRIGCRVGRRTGAGWVLPFLLPLAAIAGGHALVPWVAMWLIAIATYFAIKWLTLLAAPFALRGTEALAYIFLWPGLDPVSFRSNPAPDELSSGNLKWGVLHVCSGLLCLLWWPAGIEATVWAVPKLLFGIVQTLHFGLFTLMAAVWRKAGRDVRPIMNHPLAATSVSGFWSQRWNLAFRDAAHACIFLPLKNRFGPRCAMVSVFLASGLIHDLVMSIPAGGGYGLPTVYFLIQAGAVVLERRFRAPWLCRTFAYAVLLIPLPLLIHQPFINHIVRPLIDYLAAF